MPTTPDTERLYLLLARTALRDQQAFADLYQQTAPRLYGVALRVLRRSDWAEEVLQDCFVSIWHRAADYRRDSSAPLTWMMSIVRNRCIDWLRKPDLEVPDVDDLFVNGWADDRPSPLEQLLQHDEAGAIARCMERLEQRQKQLISLAFFHDLTHNALAEKLQLPLGTVKSWIRRGLTQLKGCLSA